MFQLKYNNNAALHDKLCIHIFIFINCTTPFNVFPFYYWRNSSAGSNLTWLYIWIYIYTAHLQCKNKPLQMTADKRQSRLRQCQGGVYIIVFVRSLNMFVVYTVLVTSYLRDSDVFFSIPLKFPWMSAKAAADRLCPFRILPRGFRKFLERRNYATHLRMVKASFRGRSASWDD